MSRNAFAQLEREYNEAAALREHAKWEREQHAQWQEAYNTGHSKGWEAGWRAHADALNRAYLDCVIDELTLEKINEYINNVVHAASLSESLMEQQ
jgi:REP element-mobilizing transposase RayT